MSGCGEEIRNACHESTATPALCRVDRCEGAEERNIDSALDTGSYVADCGTSESPIRVLSTARQRRLFHQLPSLEVPTAYWKRARAGAHLRVTESHVPLPRRVEMRFSRLLAVMGKGVYMPQSRHRKPVSRSNVSDARKRRLDFGNSSLRPSRQMHVWEIMPAQNSFQIPNLVMLHGLGLDLVRLIACSFGSDLVPKTTAAFSTRKRARPDVPS